MMTQTQATFLSSRDPAQLSDQQLRALTSFYRAIADGGGFVPPDTIRTCEDEMTRRFGGETTVYDPAYAGAGQARWFERWLR